MLPKGSFVLVLLSILLTLTSGQETTTKPVSSPVTVKASSKVSSSTTTPQPPVSTSSLASNDTDTNGSTQATPSGSTTSSKARESSNNNSAEIPSTASPVTPSPNSSAVNPEIMSPTTKSAAKADSNNGTTHATGTTNTPTTTSKPDGSSTVSSNKTLVTTLSPSGTGNKSDTSESGETTQPSSPSTKNGSPASPETTLKPDTTVKPSTAAPANSTPTTSMPNPTTANASASANSKPVTTPKPSTAVPTTTQNASTTAVPPPTTTLKPESTAAATPNITAGPTSTPVPLVSTASSTPKPTTMRPTSSSSPSTAVVPSSTDKVYINEVMMDSNGIFQKIELQMSDSLDLTHYMIVMVDGRTDKMMSKVELKNFQQQSDGLLVVNFNTSQNVPSLLDKGTGIAIYDTNRMTMTTDWTASDTGLVDALVIGKTYTGISSPLVDALTPDTNPFILDPSKYGSDMTISRCSSDQLRSTDMFALISPSFGVDNTQNCQERFSKGSEFSIKMKIDCDVIVTDERNMTEHSLTLEKVIRTVAKQVNMLCRCGVTSMHIGDPVIHCCDGPSIDMRFVAPYENQVSDLKSSYEEFLKKSSHMNVQHQLFPIDNTCSENCCNVDKHPLPSPQGDSDDKTKNVKVTIAVIVSCLFVFMMVVIVVVLYMKRKKSAVYQFRMSRLDEEDEFNVDGPDQDDFIGGHEATFDLNRR